MCFGAVMSEPTPSWSEIARQQGIAWVLLVMILLGIGAAARTIYNSMPQVIETLNNGYAKNAQELARSAEVFERTAAENRKMMRALYDAWEVERERDQRMMIELIRRADIESEVILQSIEAANKAVPDVVLPPIE